jgi:hypothetical protein
VIDSAATAPTTTPARRIREGSRSAADTENADQTGLLSARPAEAVPMVGLPLNSDADGT